MRRRAALLHYAYIATILVSAAAVYTVSWWDAPYTLRAALTAVAMVVAGGMLLYPVVGLAARVDEDIIIWVAIAGLVLALLTYPLRLELGLAGPSLPRHIFDCVALYILGMPLAFLLASTYISF